jgi:hypothetical protein
MGKDTLHPAFKKRDERAECPHPWLVLGAVFAVYKEPEICAAAALVFATASWTSAKDFALWYVGKTPTGQQNSKLLLWFAKRRMFPYWESDRGVRWIGLGIFLFDQTFGRAT